MKQLISKIILVLIIIISPCLYSCSSDKNIEELQQIEKEVSPELNIAIPTGANSWVFESPDDTKNMISDDGINMWSSSNLKIRTYFKVNKTGAINIGFRAKVNTTAESIIKFTFNGVSKEVKLSNTSLINVFAGTFNVSSTGYQYVEIQGITKGGNTFAFVSDILIGGAATTNGTVFIKDENFYWGRRNPAPNLAYQRPSGLSQASYFYNELTVPDGNDVIGTFFMANGFSEGYFGMQVNSATERQILFSVWSDFKTNDPSQVPAEYTIQEMKHGAGVTIGEFGGEGSGGQSKLQFQWKSGVTYKFLLKAKPFEDNATDFTAYFYAPELGEWKLIASFRKPKKTIYLSGCHSFLESFSPQRGDISRKVICSNQWYYDDVTKQWVASQIAKFGVSALAARGERVDYAGGSINDGYYMRANGFFNDEPIITVGTYLNRQSGTMPDINFSDLK